VQDRSPEELVVCDDMSTDGTREILEKFAAAASFPVSLQFNDGILGTIKNFEQAITFCDGDIIFLSDQDDVWAPDKISKLEELFTGNDRLGAAFCDAEIVDESLRSMSYTLWECCVFGSKEREFLKTGRAFDLLSVRNIVTGATLAFRSKYRNVFLPIPTETRLWHDGWISLLIAAVADIGFVDQPLQKYRQHPHQQLGTRLPTGNRKRLLECGDLETWENARWVNDSSSEQALRALIELRLRTFGVDNESFHRNKAMSHQ
jgi:glycosyltransferase involved in cell wall biosynthesis